MATKKNHWAEIAAQANRRICAEALVLGGALIHIKEEGVFTDLGFDRFSDYTSQVLKFGLGTAESLMRVYRAFGDLKVPREFRDVSYIALLVVCPVATQKNALSWWKRAYKLNRAELHEAVHVELERQWKNGNVRHLPLRRHHFAAKFTDIQHNTAHDALDLACERHSTKNQSESFTRICESYLRQHGTRRLKRVK